MVWIKITPESRRAAKPLNEHLLPMSASRKQDAHSAKETAGASSFGSVRSPVFRLHPSALLVTHYVLQGRPEHLCRTRPAIGVRKGLGCKQDLAYNCCTLRIFSTAPGEGIVTPLKGRRKAGNKCVNIFGYFVNICGYLSHTLFFCIQ